jgi:hypothetical protein
MQNKWADERRQKFLDALKELMDRYGVIRLWGLTAGYGSDDKFYVADGIIDMEAVTISDREDVDALLDQLIEEHRKKLIDDALDRRDREQFKQLLSPTVNCADCDRVMKRKYQCRKCGEYMCRQCYIDGHGYCSACEYPNVKRYI